MVLDGGLDGSNLRTGAGSVSWAGRWSFWLNKIVVGDLGMMWLVVVCIDMRRKGRWLI